MTRVAILGAPWSAGGETAGPSLGPSALRNAGLVPMLEELGYEVTDHGDLVSSKLPGHDVVIKGCARNAGRVAASAQALSYAAYSLMCGEVVPIFLGGDHSISMGTVNGVATHFAERGRKLFVLWFDAHADFNTPSTSPTGNMHGMSLALLCGEPSLDPIFGDTPRTAIDPRRVWLFGTRAIDPGEGELLRKRGVNVIEMALLKKAGPQRLIRHVLDIVAKAKGALHVSFDIDFLDPIIAPGVNTAVPEGATYEEAHLIMEMLSTSRVVCSFDLVELNPTLDRRGERARIIIDLVAAFFGTDCPVVQSIQAAK